jgi:hypothetical protein
VWDFFSLPAGTNSSVALLFHSGKKKKTKDRKKEEMAGKYKVMMH